MIDQRALFDYFVFRVDLIDQKKKLDLILYILDPVEKKTYFQSSGEMTSYSGRINSQSGRNDFGRTGYRAKRPANIQVKNLI